MCGEVMCGDVMCGDVMWPCAAPCRISFQENLKSKQRCVKCR
jgi:hypothetical protein